MSDINSVIKGLECCVEACHGKTVCLDCAYMHDYGGGCEAQLLQDAIDLLKERKPRVMTLEEAQHAEVVWVEDRSTGDIYSMIVKNNLNDSNLYKYGVQWRVWSARPKDEQREAMKWNE